MDVSGALIDLFTRYGYGVLVLGVMAENAGVPLPGETILLAASFLAFQGRFQLWLVILLAATGAIAGDNLGYLLGARFARPRLQRRGRFLLLTPPRLRAIEDFFQRHGDKTILLARFVSGLRVVAALFAGLSGMRWRKFVLYNSLGAFLWAGGVGLLGFTFGASWKLLERWLGLGGSILLGTAGLTALFFALRRHAAAFRSSVGALLPGALGRREGLVLLANLTALALFSKIVEDVVSGEATFFDRVLRGALRLSSPSWELAARGIGSLSSVVVIVAVAAALAALFVKRGYRKEGVCLLIVVSLAETLAWLLTRSAGGGFAHLFVVSGELPRATFPSGPVLATTASYGMVAYLAGRLWPARKWPIRWWTATLITSISVSRVALAAEWPTDVLAGAAGGLSILWGAIYIYEGSYGIVLKGLELLGMRSPKTDSLPRQKARDMPERRGDGVGRGKE